MRSLTEEALARAVRKDDGDLLRDIEKAFPECRRARDTFWDIHVPK